MPTCILAIWLAWTLSAPWWIWVCVALMCIHTALVWRLRFNQGAESLQTLNEQLDAIIARRKG